MFVDYTASDWEAVGDKIGFIPVVIDRYKSCEDFRTGLEANAYFRGENTAILAKKLMKADVIKVQTEDGTKKSLTSKEVVGNQCSSDFLYRFVVQQNQFLLGNGVNLKDAELKKKLGKAFDTRLQKMGENALLHGVCWGYWNYNHIEVVEAVKDQYSGACALYDEITGIPKVVIQFWQIAPNKPIGVRLFEEDGVTVLRYQGDGEGKTTLPEVIENKRAYKMRFVTDGAGTQEIGENYSVLPVFPLYGNPEKRSEFTHNIKSKIDAYDRIMSDFCDNLERANDIYWVLNNFGGSTDEVIEMIDTINKVKAVVNQSNATGGGATAEPRTIEVPYAARQTAIDILRKCLYQDYMALDMDEIKGGSLTNVAIKTACANLNLKADRFEWECIEFIQGILKLLNIPDEDAEIIRFNRQTISNESEVIANIYQMRDDVSREWALKANPMVNPDEVEDILKDREAEEQKAEEKEQAKAEAERKAKEAEQPQQVEVQQEQPQQAQEEPPKGEQPVHDGE